MATSQKMIRDWFERGKLQNATHMLVVCDSFEYEEYPVYITPTEDVAIVAAKYNGVNMQKIMECYDLSMDREAQVEGQLRAFNGWPSAKPKKTLPLRETLLEESGTDL